jgi:5-methyltetrahydropteroyltriglutamate--homocysteine methyltransferase
VGAAAIDIDAYPDLEEFFADLAACYRAELDALYAAGCRYCSSTTPTSPTSATR